MNKHIQQFHGYYSVLQGFGKGPNRIVSVCILVGEAAIKSHSAIWCSFHAMFGEASYGCPWGWFVASTSFKNSLPSNFGSLRTVLNNQCSRS